jgi:hypothetical protein
VVALPAADIGHADLEARGDNQNNKKGREVGIKLVFEI